ELRRVRVEPVQQLIGVVAVAALGRQAAGRGVRGGEQAEQFELGELGAHGGRCEGQAALLDEQLRAHRLPGGDELLDDTAQDLLLSLRQLQLDAHLQEFYAKSSAVTPPPRKRPRCVSASVASLRSARPSCSTRARPAGSSACRKPASGSGSSSRSPSITRSRARTSPSSSSGSRSGACPAPSPPR